MQQFWFTCKQQNYQLTEQNSYGRQLIWKIFFILNNLFFIYKKKYNDFFASMESLAMFIIKDKLSWQTDTNKWTRGLRGLL